MSDDACRKKLLRHGWTIHTSGRFDAHICPACNPVSQKTETQPEAEPAPASAPSSFLEEAWNASSPDERKLFCTMIAANLPDGFVIKPREPELSLATRWTQATTEDRGRLLAKLSHDDMISVARSLLASSREAFLRLVPYKELPLMKCWHEGSNEQRVQLVQWITSNILPTKSLEDHWKEASESERESILHRYAVLTAPPVSRTDNVVRLPVKPRITPFGAVRKSDFAREIGVYPPDISRYIHEGMPVREDGLLDRDIATRWVEDRRESKRKKRHSMPNLEDLPDTISLDDDEAIARLAARLLPQEK